MRINRQRRIWLALLAGGIVVLVFACGVLALLPRNAPVVPAAALPPHVEQRAIHIAQDHYNGMVTTTTAHATTQGQTVLRCSFIDQVQEQVAVLMDANHQRWCNNDLPLWKVMLQGRFHDPDLGNLRTLQVILAPDGNIQAVLPGEER